jgi:hypothetical protein
MPIRFNWSSKEYIPIAFIFFGISGLFQALLVFISQYLLGVGNHLVVILIPIGITIALYFGDIIIFESFAQVERKKRLKSQFSKGRFNISKFRKLVSYPLTRPIAILLPVFTIIFFIVYFISVVFLNRIGSFILAENIAAVICLLIANLVEKKYARIQRY